MTPQAGALLRHYAQHHEDRRLPWRRPGEPVARVALVEGMLAQTRARAVADRYQTIFAGVRTGADWLELADADRDSRVAPLGLGKQKRRAMDGLAEALEDGVMVLWAPALVLSKGIDPYTAAMVALLHGAHAVPISDNLDRVGHRAAFNGDPGPWISNLLRAAATRGSVTGRPPAYEVASAIMDLGATRCRPERVECPRCPLTTWCVARRSLGRQSELGLPDPVPRWIPVTVSVPVRIINEGAEDWEPREARIEAGWRHQGSGSRHSASAATHATLQAVRSALGDVPLTSTGEMNFWGRTPRLVAEAAVGNLPGDAPWLRIVVGDDTGTVTAWATEKIDSFSDDT